MVTPTPNRNDALIEPIRDASRRMVRELGFMSPTIAGTDYSASAVHAILEIGARGSVTASQLSALLRLEKSSVSRLVQKLVAAGELREKVDADDNRVKHLALTPRGKRTMAKIDRFARDRVARALAGLPPRAAITIAEGIRRYADRLADGHEAGARAANPVVTIETGYRPGIVGQMIDMQARFYATVGLGRGFESGRAIDIAQFAERLERPLNRLWHATIAGAVVGTVAVDGEDMAPAAHLRWFIVEEEIRGRGIGRCLLAAAIAFCEANTFPEIRLETFKGLNAARRLYDEAGFAVVHEERGTKWGAEVTEQTLAKQLI